MNVLAPVSTIMSTNLITVNPKDRLEEVDEIFRKNKIHHIPVVRYKKIVGIISHSDLLYFLKGLRNDKNKYDDVLNATRLHNFCAEDIMTTGLAKVESTTRINVVLEVFKENIFHAIPVVDNDELVGIVTTYDIIKALAEEPLSI